MEFRQLRAAITILFCIIAFGTAGYYCLEGMSMFDAFYMTIITLSTVGFSEIKELSIPGRTVTIIIICTSITAGAYCIGVIVRMFIEGELKEIYGRRKVEKRISELKNHYIVCGFGRIGSIICDELHADNYPFVVIEHKESSAEAVESKKYLCIRKDATTEEALIVAGIMKAKGIVTAVRSDANNVFITLTAKGLRPDIFVLSRSSDVKNEVKLKRAGASIVVSPYMIGGTRMAQVLKRPTVVDFIDLATMSNKLGLMIEESRIRPGSNLIGKNLIDSRLRQDFGVIIVAIKKQSAGEMIFNPTPTEKLDVDDVIVTLGKREDQVRMNEIL